jgi:mRNA-degrading endonuclease RelE of RelBE toxin-antitoxin system
MIRAKVEEAAENPERCKRLQYQLQGSFRLRVDKLRVIYSINRQKREMYLEKMVFRHKY